MSTVALVLLALSLPAQAEDGAVPKETQEPVKEGSAAPGTAAPFPREAIQEAVASERGRIQGCYTRRLQAAPSLEGEVTVRFRIEADGHVSAADIIEKTLEDEELERCVTAAVLELRLPASPTGSFVIVTYPFAFRTEEPSPPAPPPKKSPLEELLALLGCG